MKCDPNGIEIAFFSQNYKNCHATTPDLRILCARVTLWFAHPAFPLKTFLEKATLTYGSLSRHLHPPLSTILVARLSRHNF